MFANDSRCLTVFTGRNLQVFSLFLETKKKRCDLLFLPYKSNPSKRERILIFSIDSDLQEGQNENKTVVFLQEYPFKLSPEKVHLNINIKQKDHMN